MLQLVSPQLARRALFQVPRLASRPLALVPFSLKARLIGRILKLVLAQQADAGELEFLVGQWVGIRVTDLGLDFEVSFDGNFQVRPIDAPQVIFMAESKELLLVVAGKEDPDTLFFQRRLCIEGDTELGLEVKNLLLSIEFDSLPAPLRHSVDKLAGLLMALQARAAIA